MRLAFSEVQRVKGGKVRSRCSSSSPNASKLLALISPFQFKNAISRSLRDHRQRVATFSAQCSNETYTRSSVSPGRTLIYARRTFLSAIPCLLTLQGVEMRDATQTRLGIRVLWTTRASDQAQMAAYNQSLRSNPSKVTMLDGVRNRLSYKSSLSKHPAARTFPQSC